MSRNRERRLAATAAPCQSVFVPGRNIARNRLAILNQTFGINVDRILSHFICFIECLALGNQSRQSGTCHQISVWIIRLNKNRKTVIANLNGYVFLHMTILT